MPNKYGSGGKQAHVAGRVAKWHRVSFRFYFPLKVVGSSPVLVAFCRGRRRACFVDRDDQR